jgi:hypothetical protein
MEAVVAALMVISEICLEGQRKITEHLSEESRHDRELNQVPSEYKLKSVTI